MFYVICNDNLLISNDKETLKDYGTVLTLPEDYEEGKYVVIDGVLALNPDYLQEVKNAKYNEALVGAKDYIDNEAAYQFNENNSIEATDGNIGKMTAYALGFQTGTIEVVYWTSKEDNVLALNAEDVLRILTGLGEIQGVVWNVQFVAYKTAIEEAATPEEVKAIVIDYSTPITLEEGE